jgi:hypothetical protein
MQRKRRRRDEEEGEKIKEHIPFALTTFTQCASERVTLRRSCMRGDAAEERESERVIQRM